MTTERRHAIGRRAFLKTASFTGIVLVAESNLVRAHNNPSFKEVLLLSVDVSAAPIEAEVGSVHSEPFRLDLPKKTIELVWRVTDPAAKEATFSVAQGENLHAEGLHDGATSRILRGDDIRIVDVAGTSEPFAIEIYANVIDRSTAKSG